jgi:hypothetical protein
VGSAWHFYREAVQTCEAGPNDPCLIWPFARDEAGYGILGRGKGRTKSVSRRICEETYGLPPTPEHETAHSCGRGNDGCVTIGHLRWATRAENMADRLIHGTSNRGARHGMAKLTEADVVQIRNLCGHHFQREIAERFGIDQSTVSDIRRRKLWAWL